MAHLNRAIINPGQFLPIKLPALGTEEGTNLAGFIAGRKRCCCGEVQKPNKTNNCAQQTKAGQGPQHQAFVGPKGRVNDRPSPGQKGILGPDHSFVPLPLVVLPFCRFAF